MFDLDTGIKDKFLSDTWIPVPYEDNTKTAIHLNIESTAVKGDIPYIRVDDGGENYTTAPEIEIRGDGTGATAIAIMNGEKIESIQISDMGTGYTHAEVHIFGNGNGAKLTAMVSPNDGHGSNAFYELGKAYKAQGNIKETILSSEAKVADLILNEIEIFNRVKNNEIASILNITPETLSRILGRLKKENIISINSHIVEVLNIEALHIILEKNTIKACINCIKEKKVNKPISSHQQMEVMH
jgi:DNA-binding CsgD family transcriptional regulator